MLYFFPSDAYPTTADCLPIRTKGRPPLGAPFCIPLPINRLGFGLCSKLDTDHKPTRLKSTLYAAKPASLVRHVRNTDDIRKHARGGDGGAGAVALDEHRVVVVAFGGEEDDVVGAVEGVEGVVLVEGP